MRLLKDCPSCGRKELLMTIRHIINFTSRKPFLPIMDEVLEERTLIGNDLTALQKLRPLAYAMLADLIGHVHKELPPHTVVKVVVEVYTDVLREDLPGTAMAVLSIRLLHETARSLPQILGVDDARHCWMLFLKAIGDRFAAMNRNSNFVKLYPQGVEDSVEGTSGWDKNDIIMAGPIKVSALASDSPAEDKYLLTTSISALKEVINLLGLSTIDPNNAPGGVLSVEERQIFLKFTKEGAGVFRRWFASEDAEDDLQTSRIIAQFKDMAARHASPLESDAMAGGNSDQVHLQRAIESLEPSAIAKYGSQLPPGVSFTAMTINALNILAKECLRGTPTMEIKG